MNLSLVTWNKRTYQAYLNYLLSLKDSKYQEFSSKLIFTKYKMIGIRIPLLRTIAKNISDGNYEEFLKYTESYYFEEVLIEGLVIASIKDKTIFDKYFLNYIKKIDNWSINDVFCNSIKIFDQVSYFDLCLKLSQSKEEFISRVGLISILSHYVKEPNLNKIFNTLDSLQSDKYYTKMAASWLLCECFIKYPNITNKYLSNSKLNDWTYNKAIQKMRESYRVTVEQKAYLITLKR